MTVDREFLDASIVLVLTFSRESEGLDFILEGVLYSSLLEPLFFLSTDE